MKLTVPFTLLFFVVLSLFAEDPRPEARVFPAGNAGKGQLLFEEKQCHRCHTVEGKKFADADLPGIDFIHLGGEYNRNFSRDYFAREIMNPEHLISPLHQKAMIIIGDRLGAENSPMPNFGAVLKVNELIDLAAFLEEASSAAQ